MGHKVPDENDSKIVVEHFELLDEHGRPVPRKKRKKISLHGTVLSYSILGICTVFYPIFQALPDEIKIQFTFSPGNGHVIPGLITHMFAHGDLLHLLGNMCILFFLGTYVERTYGPARFSILYLGTGLIAALSQAVVSPFGYLIGASGALAGVMAAFVRHYPHVKLYIWGILPIPAWLAMALWLVYNILGTQGELERGVAFTAHLAGFASGLVISLLLVQPGTQRVAK